MPESKCRYCDNDQDDHAWDCPEAEYAARVQKEALDCGSIYHPGRERCEVNPERKGNTLMPTPHWVFREFAKVIKGI